MLDKLNYLVFTFFHTGKLPASGTFASVITVLIYYFIVSFFFKHYFYINTYNHNGVFFFIFKNNIKKI